MSVQAEAWLAREEVVVSMTAPLRAASRWTLRLPDPPGYRIAGAAVGDMELLRDAGGRVDLTGRTGMFAVLFSVRAK